MRWTKFALSVLIVAFHAFPFYLILMLALKPATDTRSKWAPPQSIDFNNFSDAWSRAHLGQALTNNIVITFSAIVLVILIGSFAAYPLSRYRTRWNNFIYLVCVSCMIVPALTILVPLYKIMVDLHGINTHWAIIFTHVTFSLPMTIFLYSGFISSISKELDEAALMDGCHHFAIFFRIILPLLRPITATVVIILGVQVWNDYQFSVFFLQDRSVQTIPVALSFFISQFSNQINWVAAGCLVGMLPMTVMYMLFQKMFIKGMAEGAVKG